MNTDKDYIYNKIHELLNIASKKYVKHIPKIEVDFNLTGACAGSFIIRDGRAEKFRFNMEIFRLNSDNFDQTIIHEVAHYVTCEKYGYFTGVKPHGREWKSVVILLGGKPKRCHDLKMPKSTRKSKSPKFEYKCNCQTLMISKTIHKRITWGKIYRCCSCKGILKRVY